MIGNKVYIRPECIDFVNPLTGENSVNYKIWNVQSTSEETTYHVSTLPAPNKSWFMPPGEVISSHRCYTIECDGFVIRNVRETFLMGLDEARDKKIQQIID